MHNIPDIRVWRTANEYQEVSMLCNQHGKIWGGAINAALAIEIYLKSFLSKEVLVSIGDGFSQSFKKTARGHDLFELYGKIPCDLQNKLSEQYAAINSKLSLPDMLNKHKDVFFYARYPHEKDAIKHVGNDIIYFARDLRDVVLKVAELVHPPIIKPAGLRGFVERQKTPQNRKHNK